VLLRKSLSLFQELSDRAGIADCLNGLAGVLAGKGDVRRAVRLLGAADALRTATGVPLPPSDRTDRERTVGAIRLLIDDRAFAAAYHEGQTEALETTVAAAAG
jgi:hypothetical protein